MRALVLNDDLAVVNGRDGTFLVNRHDQFIGAAIEKYGEYSGIEAGALGVLTQPNDVVIDVGANIGALTVGLAKRVGPQGQVYAFEPQRACYALLQAQLALNQLRNVYAYNEALGAVEELQWLPAQDYRRQGNFGAVALNKQQGQHHEAVRVRKLDDACGHLQTVGLIKIDVEGMEREVIAGGRELIGRTKPLLYVENDLPERSPALIALIQELGYRLWWHVTPLFNARNAFGVEENPYGDRASFNMLCVHPAKPMPQHSLPEIKTPNDPHPMART